MTERLRLGLAFLLVGALAGGGWMASQPPPPDQGVMEGSVQALEAWGRFAGSGDLSELTGSFADGPQLDRLRSESESIEPGAAYRFLLTDAEVIEPGVVRGIVTVSRGGESDQVFHWDIALVQEDGRWRLWTVRTSEP